MAQAQRPELNQARPVLGAAFMMALVFALAWPLLHRQTTPDPAAPAGTPLGSQSATPAPSGSAVEQIQQLQAASERLKRAAANVTAAAAGSAEARPGEVPPKAKPEPTQDATTCIESLVPEGTFGPGSLDWVCLQPDLWSLQLDLYSRAVKRGKGDGAARWVTLGRSELGAIAILRTTCCPGAAPFVAKVPVQNCGSLPEVLTALATAPTPDQVRRYHQTMSCLAERKVWFPEGWKRVNDKQGRQSFDAFLTSLLERARR